MSQPTVVVAGLGDTGVMVATRLALTCRVVAVTTRPALVSGQELGIRLARTLGVNPEHLIPGYEDVFYYTWKERRLPSNVTPEKSHLKNKQERERLAVRLAAVQEARIWRQRER